MDELLEKLEVLNSKLNQKRNRQQEIVSKSHVLSEIDLINLANLSLECDNLIEEIFITEREIDEMKNN